MHDLIGARRHREPLLARLLVERLLENRYQFVEGAEVTACGGGSESLLDEMIARDKERVGRAHEGAPRFDAARFARKARTPA